MGASHCLSLLWQGNRELTVPNHYARISESCLKPRLSTPTCLDLIWGIAPSGLGLTCSCRAFHQFQHDATYKDSLQPCLVPGAVGPSEFSFSSSEPQSTQTMPADFWTLRNLRKRFKQKSYLRKPCLTFIVSCPIENYLDDSSRFKWQNDLQQIIDQREWYVIHRCIKLISSNVSIRENYYKLRLQWYYTPDRLHKMFPAEGAYCWRFKKKTGNIQHICWICPRVYEF